jgi:digeranylgeranylglycerophospholipid reductase
VIKLKFDVIIVGAGTAGCLAAKTTAEAGLNVCLVENKRTEEIGEKICGDALGEHHLRQVGLEDPQSGELEKRIEGIRIHSPDMQTTFTIAHEAFKGFILNRHAFGQWLLNKAVGEGATLMDSTRCTGPMIEKAFVTGISARNLKTGKKEKLESSVVVDASGFVAAVRRNLPESIGIEADVANEDVEACYREIRQLRQESEESRYCEIYLSQKATKGGYAWVFPKTGARVNAGVGICMRHNFPNPKTQFYKHVLTRSMFEGSLLLNSGAWYDPTRRPFDSMVGNGVMIMGDVACLVNPIHGGGIGPSMLSGFLGGKTIVEALQAGSASREALWPYNRRYMESYGGKQASLDVFRLLLLSSRDEDLNYGMNYELLTEGDVLRASMGDDFHLKVTETARRVFKGLKNLRFLNKLRVTADLMKRVRAHYREYPENPEGFPEWKKQTEELFTKAKTKLVK